MASRMAARVVAAAARSSQRQGFLPRASPRPFPSPPSPFRSSLRSIASLQPFHTSKSEACYVSGLSSGLYGSSLFCQDMLFGKRR